MKLSDKLYVILKWCAILFLPACGSLYIALDRIWGFGYSYEVASSISAVCVFLGAILGISSASYSAERQQLEDEIQELRNKSEDIIEEETEEEETEEEILEPVELKASGRVYLSPSNQTDNIYAYGGCSEAEHCEDIARLVGEKLLDAGVDVMIADRNENMEVRCNNSNDFGADLHIPIHSNAFNREVGGCRVFYVSDNGKYYGTFIYDILAPYTPGTSNNLSYNGELYELNNPAATSVYIEIDFHDVEDIAKWISSHHEGIAQKIAEGICEALNNPLSE